MLVSDLALAGARAARRRASSSSIDTAIFRRASGERSSWLALASRIWCERTSASMRSAAWLKLARHARPPRRARSASTRWSSAPAPKRSTPCFSALEPARQAAHHRVGAGGHGQRTAAPAAATRPAPRGQAAAAAPAAAAAVRGPPAPQRAGRAHAAAAARRSTHSVRPSSRRIGRPRAIAGHLGGRGAGTTRWRRCAGPARRPAPSARAGAATTRAAPRPARSRGASAGGSERWIRSPQAADALAHLRFERAALGLHLALQQPARAEREQRQRRHHREVDAQVERSSSRRLPASWRLANT